MGRRGTAGLGLAALALVAGVAWWLSSGTGDSVSVRPTTSPGVATAEPAPGALLPPAAPDDEATLLDSSGPDSATASLNPTEARAVLTLEVRRASDGAPVPDVECKLYAHITDGEPKNIRAAGRTGADGAWRTEFEHAVEVWLVEALPGAGHAYVEERPDLAIGLGESKSLVIEAALGTTVRGRVVDGDERPVPQAGVLAWCDYHYNVEHGDGPPPDPHARATCDSAGRFELHGMGPAIVLVPEAAGMAAVSGMAGPTPGDGSADVKLVLGPAAELRGRVVDPAGRPVATTWVTGHSGYVMMQGGLEPISPIKVANATDSNGRFVLAPIAPRRLRVDVNADGFPPWSRGVTPDGSELFIQLESGLGLAGMVYGADGTALDGVDVQLWGATELEHGEARGFIQTKTSRGEFVFEALVPSTTAVLGVSAPGHAVFVLEPIATDATPKVPLEIRLDPELRIAGQVVDEHGQPLKGALVAVRGDRAFASRLYRNKAWEEIFWPRVSETSTGDDGRFRIGRLYDGLFELTVVDPRSPDWRPEMDSVMFGAADWKHVQQVRSGTEDLLIRLDPAQLRRAVVEGTVTDALSGQPLQEFSVFMKALDPKRVRLGPMPGGQFDDEHGAFHVEGLEPGRWQAHVWADGYAPGRSGELELREGEQRVDLTVLPERSLHMRIVDQDREPVYGAYVKFEDARGELELESQPKGEGTIGMTDKAGELLAYGLPADRITIVLTVPLVRGAAVGRQTVRVTADLRVQPEGVLEFSIERRHVRCLVLSLHEMDAPPETTVYDTDDEASTQVLHPLIEQDLMRSIGRPLTVTVTAADGTLVDTARCAPNTEIGNAWRVTSSVCDSAGEPTSWLAVALPASESKVAIVAEGYQPVILDLPGGEDHLKRYVILRPAAD